MKRFTKFLLYILLIISFSKITVKAAVNHGYNQSFQNNCVEQKTCMLLCAYTNKIESNKETNYYSSYIYYDFESSRYFIEWMAQKNKAYHYLLGEDRIKLDNNTIDNLSKGICPTNSYVDKNGLFDYSEVCFESEKNYCFNKNDAATTFEGESTFEYNFQNEFKSYYEEWDSNINKYTCDEFRNSNINIVNEFNTEFRSKYLYNYEIPSFIKRSNEYKNGLMVISEKVTEKVNSLKIRCDFEVNNAYNNDKINEIEKKLLLEKNKQVANNLVNQINESITIKIIDSDDNVDNCQSLLGNPKDPNRNTPAYYLSFAFKVIRYIAIIILIVFSTIDFVSAITSHDDDELKKAMNKTIKRLVLCIVIFLLPTLLEFILKIIDDYSIRECIEI